MARIEGGAQSKANATLEVKVIRRDPITGEVLKEQVIETQRVYIEVPNDEER